MKIAILILLAHILLLTDSSLQAQNHYCLCFDGVDDYTETPSDALYENIVDSISICAWIRLESVPTDGNATIIARRNFIGNPTGERHHFQLTITNDLAIGFSSQNNENQELYTTILNSDPNVISLNEWTHVAITFNNGLLIFYKNGEEVISHDFGYKELFPNNHWINIGIVHRSAGNPFFSPFHGKLDEINIWHEVLTVARINEIRLGMGIEGANLISYWNFEEGSGTSTRDTTGNTLESDLLGGVDWSTEVPIQIDDKNHVGAQIESSNLFMDSPSINGIILKDADGICWKITVNTSGQLITHKVVCPTQD